MIYKTIGLFSPIILLYFVLSSYYTDHFYNNATMNGIDISNMTISQAEDAFYAKARDYSLLLEGRNGIRDTIAGKDIGLHIVYKGDIKSIMEKQNGFLWPIAIFRPHKLRMDTQVLYDESKLEEQIENLTFFDKENIIEPVNARISEYGLDGYAILPQDKGAKVNADALHQVIKKAISSLESDISLDDNRSYEEPKIYADNPMLLSALDSMNNIVKAQITYEFGNKIEILDGSQISKWLSVDNEIKVVLDPTGVKEYVDYIGKTYNTFGKTRTFKTSYGETIEVKGGDYGWWLDRATEAKELTDLILDGVQVVKTPAYYQIAQQYGEDDIGDTYVEVNLTAQHLFFYKEGKLVVESDFVSGNLSKNYGTPTGTYPVQYKENDATLNGEDYSTPVKYWMPFNGNIGFHDASWRNRFGKNIYQTNGSHGCINMPPKAAKVMFEHIQRGVAVIVYELEGTESYNIKEDKKLIEPATSP